MRVEQGHRHTPAGQTEGGAGDWRILNPKLVTKQKPKAMYMSNGGSCFSLYRYGLRFGAYIALR